jgi:hypothetical protein
MVLVTLPSAGLCEKRNLLGATVRALYDAIRPTQGHHEVVAVFITAEELNRLL